MNKHPLHFALLGCGRIGARHAAIIDKVGKLVAVCDTAIEKAQAFATQFGATAFTDLYELLAQKELGIEVVVVCTPNGWHARHSIAALHAGAHVLCEKPMAIKSKDVMAMMEAARQANRHLVVVKQNRFNPPVAAVKDLLDKQALGKILQVQCNAFWNRPAAYYAQSAWRGTKALDGGTLFTQFSHFIDLLIWFFGPINIQWATTAQQLHTSIEIEDSGIFTGMLANGALLGMEYNVTAFNQNMEGAITIFGEKGVVKIGGQYLNELSYQQLEGPAIEHLPTGNGPNQYGQYLGSMSNHEQVYTSFIPLLNELPMGNQALADAAETVKTIETVYARADSPRK